MKLEVGKYYRTRDGRKAGPLRYYPYEDTLVGMVGGVKPERLWLVDGGKHKYYEDEIDLIEEWKEETTMDKITMDGKYAYRKDPFTQVRILCVDRGGPFANNIVTVDVDGDVSFYREGGHAYGKDYDLVPLQVKLPDLWGLIYPDGAFYPATNKEQAEDWSNSSTYDVKVVKYIPAPDQTS